MLPSENTTYNRFSVLIEGQTHWKPAPQQTAPVHSTKQPSSIFTELLSADLIKGLPSVMLWLTAPAHSALRSPWPLIHPLVVRALTCEQRGKKGAEAQRGREERVRTGRSRVVFYYPLFHRVVFQVAGLEQGDTSSFSWWQSVQPAAALWDKQVPGPRLSPI